jgi:hypothetical protein
MAGNFLTSGEINSCFVTLPVSDSSEGELNQFVR